MEECVVEKVIYSDPRTSAGEYGLLASLSMLAAMAQTVAVSLSFSM